MTQNPGKYIEPVNGDGGPFYRIKDGNGQILLVSEIYSSPWSRNRSMHRMATAFGIPVHPRTDSSVAR